MVRIVVDTNVVISALVFGGAPRSVLDLAAAGLCECCFSRPIRDEAKRVLIQKFGWAEVRAEAALTTLSSWFKEIKPTEKLAVIKDDPDDDRIVECAVASGAQFIISGDRHLLLLGNFRSIRIMTVREFLDNKCWVPSDAE